MKPHGVPGEVQNVLMDIYGIDCHSAAFCVARRVGTQQSVPLLRQQYIV
jgi:hypothetical protein